MNFSFANPAWLLAAFVAVPLLAHLFSRTRPRRREFPSLKLLREAMRQVTRVRKPRDRWLLIVRTLAMIALIGAFLQPWLLSRFASGTGVAKTVVLVLDASASMSWADGTQTRLAQATTAAEEVLATLPANSRANVVWVRGSAASELPEPGPNLDFLRDALRKATAHPESGDIVGAFSLALKQLGSAEGDRELIILSDFQRTAWREANLETPTGIRLTRIAVGSEEAANLALAGLALEPARPVAGQDARIICRVRNFSAGPRRATLFAEAGESRLSQSVEIAPWSETLAVLPVKFPKEGIVPVKATLGEDPFPADNTRHALAEVRGALQIAIAGTDDDATAKTWMRAARALDSVSARFIKPAEIAEARAELLFYPAWKGGDFEALTAFAKRGGAIIIQPAEGLDAAATGKWLGLAAADGALGIEKRDSGWGLRIAAEDHPMFALFAAGAFGDPTKGTFRSRTTTPQFVEKALLAYDDAQPALTLLDFNGGAEKPTAVAWWNLDLATSDWATRTTFVPFFGEFVRHLAARTQTPALRVFEPGSALRLEAGALDAKGIRLINEAGREVPLDSEKPGILVAKEPAVPGNYQWATQDGVLDHAVVNFPETESDLRRMNTEELDRAAGTLVSTRERTRLSDLREGHPLWAWFLAAAAAFFLIEGLLLKRFQTPEKSAPTPNPKREEASV